MKVVERMVTGAGRAAVIVVVCASIFLLGALLDMPLLAAPLGGAPMKAWTAVSFILAGLSLWLWTHRRAPTFARALGGLVASSGAAIIMAWLGGSETALGFARPAVSTGILFFAVGAALVVFEAKVGTARVAEIIGIAAYAYWWSCAIDLALGAAMGSEATAPAHVFVHASRQMSPYTCVLFFWLPPTLLNARPRDGWMRIVSADTPAGRTTRAFIIGAPFGIVGITIARFYGEYTDHYDARFGVALMAAAMIFVIVSSAWLTLAARFDSEEALRSQRAVLDAIVENIPHMIFVKDGRELRFLRFNAAGERLLGMKREELIGKNDFDFFPKEQAEFFQAKDRAALALALANGDEGGDANVSGKLDIEEQIETKNGKRWLRTVKVAVAMEHGAPAFLLGISEDITSRKAAEDELRRAKEAAEATSKELEAFSYSVSHDLRAPLRSIDGFSLAVLEDFGDKLDADAKDNLERVRAAAQRMATLIDDLLNLSRVSRHPLREEPVDLSGIATSIVAELRRVDPERHVQVTIAPGLRATGDGRLIEVLLQNLIGNAWKFTRKKSEAHIEVGAVDVEGERRFFVNDDGAGFDMSYANKLFGAFQRLHGASEFEGTGIGLATVQRIAARHGGRVWAEGAVGQGARFSFRLGKAAAGSTLGPPVADPS